MNDDGTLGKVSRIFMIQEGIKVEGFPLSVEETGEEGRAESREGKIQGKQEGNIQWLIVDMVIRAR